MDLRKARELVGGIWTWPGNEDIEMDARLAESFANLLCAVAYEERAAEHARCVALVKMEWEKHEYETTSGYEACESILAAIESGEEPKP